MEPGTNRCKKLLMDSVFMCYQGLSLQTKTDSFVSRWTSLSERLFSLFGKIRLCDEDVTQSIPFGLCGLWGFLVLAPVSCGTAHGGLRRQGPQRLMTDSKTR